MQAAYTAKEQVAMVSSWNGIIMLTLACAAALVGVQTANGLSTGDLLQQVRHLPPARPSVVQVPVKCGPRKPPEQ